MSVARTLKTGRIFSVDVKQLVLCFCNWFSFWVSVASIGCQSCAWLAANAAAAAAWCLLRCSVGICGKNRRALLIGAIVFFFPRREKKQWLSSPEAISAQRDMEMRFCNRWPSYLLSATYLSKMTMLAFTERCAYRGRPPEWNGHKPQPGSRLKTCGISLGALLMPEWPTQQRWLTWDTCWLKTCDAIPQQRVSRSLWFFFLVEQSVSVKDRSSLSQTVLVCSEIFFFQLTDVSVPFGLECEMHKSCPVDLLSGPAEEDKSQLFYPFS